MNLFRVAFVGLWVMRNLMFLYVISTGAGLFIRAIADNEKLIEIYKNGRNLQQPPKKKNLQKIREKGWGKEQTERKKRKLTDEKIMN